jgi:hypothetical protein
MTSYSKALIMISATITRASNFTLQPTTGSRCSPIVAERRRYPAYVKHSEAALDGMVTAPN